MKVEIKDFETKESDSYQYNGADDDTDEKLTFTIIKPNHLTKKEPHTK